MQSLQCHDVMPQAAAVHAGANEMLTRQNPQHPTALYVLMHSCPQIILINKALAVSAFFAFDYVLLDK